MVCVERLTAGVFLLEASTAGSPSRWMMACKTGRRSTGRRRRPHRGWRARCPVALDPISDATTMSAVRLSRRNGRDRTLWPDGSCPVGKQRQSAMRSRSCRRARARRPPILVTLQVQVPELVPTRFQCACLPCRAVDQVARLLQVCTKLSGDWKPRGPGHAERRLVPRGGRSGGHGWLFSSVV